MEAPIRIASEPRTKARVGIVTSDECPMCNQEFEHGQFGVVIGMVDKDLNATLAWVHRECIMRDVLGDQLAESIIAFERSE